MRFYTADYANCNHNFVIQNLKKNKDTASDLATIAVLKNILQRGVPTLLSRDLQKKIDPDLLLNKNPSFHPLIDRESPVWSRTIKGAAESSNNPAEKFFNELIPKYLKEYGFVNQLIRPEVLINDITQEESDEFAEQKVDFYLSQVLLVVEIDGKQHEKQEYKDKKRDNHLYKKRSIKTIRIKAGDVKEENSNLLSKMDQIYRYLKHKAALQDKEKIENPLCQSLNTYKIYYEVQKTSSDRWEASNTYLSYKSSAIIRFQILVLELLENGMIEMGKKSAIELIERDVHSFADIALDDLNSWFKNLLRLQKKKFKPLRVEIKKITSTDKFSSLSDTIKVDFSLKKRWTDEFELNPEIVYLRTDYFDKLHPIYRIYLAIINSFF